MRKKNIFKMKSKGKSHDTDTSDSDSCNHGEVAQCSPPPGHKK